LDLKFLEEDPENPEEPSEPEPAGGQEEPAPASGFLKKGLFALTLLGIVGVAFGVLLPYVSNVLTFEATVTTSPIQLEVVYNELDGAEEVIAGNTYQIVIDTKNLANNPISDLQTRIVCTANPSFESADELSMEAYFYDNVEGIRDPEEGTYPIEKSYDPETGAITFYIPSMDDTWEAGVGYDTTTFAFVTTAPNIEPGTTINCNATVFYGV